MTVCVLNETRPLAPCKAKTTTKCVLRHPTAQLIGEEPRLDVVRFGCYFPAFPRFYRQELFYAHTPDDATDLFGKVKQKANLAFKNAKGSKFALVLIAQAQSGLKTIQAFGQTNVSPMALSASRSDSLCSAA